MDYRKHYDRLIERAQHRQIKDFTETHHIIPSCMEGTDDKENLVELTPEEHYIAHLLLLKLYPTHEGIIYAAKLMANVSNKSFGWVKRRHREMISEAKKQNIEYNGQIFRGWDHLKRETGVTRHLYLTYYGKGIDPKELIGKNNIHQNPLKKNEALLVKKQLANSLKGRIWYNNGENEVHSFIRPKGWKKGRLSHLRDERGRYSKDS